MRWRGLLLWAWPWTPQRPAPTFRKKAWSRDVLKGESITHQGRKNKLQTEIPQRGSQAGRLTKAPGLMDRFQAPLLVSADIFM